MSCRRSTEAAPSPRFLIVQTGTTLPQLRARHGDFAEWFRRGLGLNREEAVVTRVDTGATLPEARGYAAIIVTGSSAMVSERLRWSEETAAWLRGAIAVGVPVLRNAEPSLKRVVGDQVKVTEELDGTTFSPRGSIGPIAYGTAETAADWALRVCARSRAPTL